MKKFLLTLLFLGFCSNAHAVTYYLCSNSGNANWTTTTIWTTILGDETGCIGGTGAAPSTSDTAILNSTSGAVTLTTNTTITTLNMTGYASTLSFGGNNSLTISNGATFQGGIAGASNCNFVVQGGGITLAGAITMSSNVTLSMTTASETMTSNGNTWPGAMQINFNGGIFTLVGNWTVSQSLNIGNPCQINFTTAETLTVNGGLSMSQGTTHDASSATITLASGTWSGSGSMSNPFIIAGNVTVSGTVAFGTASLTYSSGTVTTTGSTLNINASGTLNSAGIVWNNMLFNTANETLTLGSNLTLIGSLESNQAGSPVIAGAYNVNVGTLALDGTNASFTFPSGQTLTVTSALNLINASTIGNQFTIKSGTASSPFYLVYQGNLANEVISKMTFTDVYASGPSVPFYRTSLFSYSGGTLLRTSGIVNVTASNIHQRVIQGYNGSV